MGFRLLGIPIRVGPSFLLLQIGLAVFITVTLPTTPWLKMVAFLIIGAIVLVSVLVHEMGHALAARRAGLRPEITLTWFGGFTRFVANVGPGKRLWISAAGVVLQAAMAGLVWLLIRNGAFGDSELVATIAEAFVLFNLVMAAINLIPVGGMDGGAILGSVLELLRVPRPRLVLLVIYGVGGVAITVFALVRANWILFPAGVYLTYVGLRSQLPYVRFEQDAAAHPGLEAAVRRLLMTHRYREAADTARQALAAADSPPYRIYATTVLLDALRLAGAGDELTDVLASADLAGVDPVAIGRAQLAAGDHAAGADTLSTALARSGDGRVGALLAEAHLAAGHHVAAARVVTEMPAAIPTVDIWDLHRQLLDRGALGEARLVRQALTSIRTTPLGAVALMLIAEGSVDEGLAMLQRDFDLAANRTAGTWLQVGLDVTETGAPEGRLRVRSLPGELAPESAAILVHVLAATQRPGWAAEIGLPIASSGGSPGSAFEFEVAVALDATGRTAEANDVLAAIEPGFLLVALTEYGDLERVRRTPEFAELVERLAHTRI